MAASPEFTLALTPRHRFDLIDVNARLRAQHGDVLHGFSHALYASYHTTAGYLEAPDLARCGPEAEAVRRYVAAYRKLYPEGAGYRHDRLEDRSELTDEQKATEPLNGDAHLSFIGAGLTNCVTYPARPAEPALFVDLDGVGVTGPRARKTTVVGFDREVEVARLVLPAPVSEHRVDSFNLRDPRVGVFDAIQDHVRRLGLAKGRVDVALAGDDLAAALTVNEFETLLMQHDLADVLRNPLRYAMRTGWHALQDLRDLRAAKEKVKDYAKYDLVLVLNDALDRSGLRGSVVDRALSRLVAAAARRRLCMKRAVSFPVSDHDADGAGEVVQGTYQSPVLLQWGRYRRGRTLDVRIVAFA